MLLLLMLTDCFWHYRGKAAGKDSGKVAGFLIKHWQLFWSSQEDLEMEAAVPSVFRNVLIPNGNEALFLIDWSIDMAITKV